MGKEGPENGRKLRPSDLIRPDPIGNHSQRAIGLPIIADMGYGLAPKGANFALSKFRNGMEIRHFDQIWWRNATES